MGQGVLKRHLKRIGRAARGEDPALSVTDGVKEICANFLR